MFGVSGFSETTSFARRADAAKVRTATDPEELDERMAALNGRPTASRRAIVEGIEVKRPRCSS
jgi:hypothetical protein